MKCVLFLTFLTAVFCSELNSTIKTVHIIFRHGMRNPKQLELYPTDPFLNLFNDTTYAQLTTNGKKGSYELGNYLRKRYSNIIGKNYNSDTIFTKSTPSDRTIMTARLVLGGMFQEPLQQVLTHNLYLNSLPFQLEIEELDINLYADDFNCTKFTNEYEHVLSSKDYNSLIQQYKNVFEYISNKSGKNISNFNDVNSIYHALCAEEYLNFTLPKWTESVYPEQIHNLASVWLNFANYNTALKRINGGNILKTVLDMMDNSINNNFKGQKLFLYSGHDRTIVSVLAALNLYQIHIPKYNSALLMELHEVDELQQYIIKIFYVRNSQFDSEQLLIPMCEQHCELQSFKQLFKSHIPEGHKERCIA